MDPIPVREEILRPSGKGGDGGGMRFVRRLRIAGTVGGKRRDVRPLAGGQTPARRKAARRAASEARRIFRPSLPPPLRKLIYIGNEIFSWHSFISIFTIKGENPIKSEGLFCVKYR